jgi:hypothetical protein
MKHLILFVAFVLTYQLAISQTIEVENFKHEPTDLRARRPGVKDLNNEYCALVIVATWSQDVKFSGNSVFKVEQKSEGYWVWFTPNARRVTIEATGYTSKFYDFPNPLKGQDVYIITLKMDRIGQFASAKVVSLTFSINQPDVFIAKDKQAGVQTAGNTARYMVAPGKHSFTFSKQGFSDYSKEYSIKGDTTISINLAAGTSGSKFQPPSILSINSTPIGASVYANQQLIGQTPVQKMLVPGEYSITITKDLFQDHNTSVKLEPSVPLDLGTIALKSISAQITVQSSPLGADIYLDNRFIGKSPIVGKEVNSGSYKLEAKLNDYRTWSQDITLDKGDKKTFTPTLLPSFGELVVNTQPISGVSVYINGRKEGVSPFTSAKLSSGNYEVEVRDEVNQWKDNPLWLGAKENITITDGKRTERTLTLLQNFGELSIKAEGSEIYLDKEKVGVNSLDIKLPSGTYSLTGKRNKHHDASQTVNVSVAAKQNIELTPQPILGAVSVITKPFEARGATIEVDGKTIKEKTPAVLPLLIGSYNISVNHPKYLPQSKSVVIRNEGDQQELSFDLVSFTGSYAHKAKQWKNRKYMYLVLGIAANAAGGYLHMKSEDSYTQYKSATSSTEADRLRNEVAQFENYGNISIGVSIVPAYLFFHSMVKQKKYKRMANNN